MSKDKFEPTKKTVTSLKPKKTVKKTRGGIEYGYGPEGDEPEPLTVMEILLYHDDDED